MKKQAGKKLSLSTETVRALPTRDVELVNGGATTAITCTCTRIHCATTAVTCGCTTTL